MYLNQYEFVSIYKIEVSTCYILKNWIIYPFHRVSVLPTYYVPKDGPLSSYKEYVSMLPNIDHPEAFGQHPNADITSQIQETRLLFETLLSLQPQQASGAGESREEKVGTWPCWLFFFLTEFIFAFILYLCLYHVQKHCIIKKVITFSVSLVVADWLG